MSRVKIRNKVNLYMSSQGIAEITAFPAFVPGREFTEIEKQYLFCFALATEIECRKKGDSNFDCLGCLLTSRTDSVHSCTDCNVLNKVYKYFREAIDLLVKSEVVQSCFLTVFHSDVIPTQPLFNELEFKCRTRWKSAVFDVIQSQYSEIDTHIYNSASKFLLEQS